MNKKLLSIIASATLFSNLALADENSGFFIGADAAWMHAQVKSELNIRIQSKILMEIFQVIYHRLV